MNQVLQNNFDADYNFVERVMLNSDNEIKHEKSLHNLVRIFKIKWSKKYPHAHKLLFYKIIYNNWNMRKLYSMKRRVIVEKTKYP